MEKNIYLTRKAWSDQVRGWVITDCCVRGRTFVSLCLREGLSGDKAAKMWDHDIQARLFVMNLEKPGTIEGYGSRTLVGYNKPRLGVATVPKAQSLLVARNNDGQVSVMGGGAKFPDEFIAPAQVPMIWRVKTIDGYAYSVGGQRQIYKREDLGKWVKVVELPGHKEVSRVGFADT